MAGGRHPPCPSPSPAARSAGLKIWGDPEALGSKTVPKVSNGAQGQTFGAEHPMVKQVHPLSIVVGFYRTLSLTRPSMGFDCRQH